MKTERHIKEIFAKIISDADVIFQVLDARNPLGTRNLALEEFIQKNAPDKKIFLVLNKIDMLPRPILTEWIQYLKKTTPYDIYTVSALYNRGIIAFKKSLAHIFSKKQTKAIIIGYPNTGKSSLIQALSREKKKIGISSRAGYTRGIMEIKISQHLSLFDTPGIIPISEDSEVEQAVKGVINPEKIIDKEAVVQSLIELYVTPSKLLEHFGIDLGYIKTKFPEQSEDFIKKYLISDEKMRKYSDFELLIQLIGFKRGYLKIGGEVNENKVFNTIIHAWQKNQIKFFTYPPNLDVNA
ncbi:MAG: 50S ribosome-binding GTPase [Candidatus Lokiarchaeota archaeon]|nr:50S ribosome-binding GTPase [Candidatus Lokiarchaeota archaeon]